MQQEEKSVLTCSSGRVTARAVARAQLQPLAHAGGTTTTPMVLVSKEGMVQSRVGVKP